MPAEGPFRCALRPDNADSGSQPVLITAPGRFGPGTPLDIRAAFAAKFRVAGEGFGTYCSCRDGNASRTGAAMTALRGDEARAARLPQVACMPNGAAGQCVGWGPQCTGTVLSWRDGQRSERVPSSLWTRMSNSCSLRTASVTRCAGRAAPRSRWPGRGRACRRGAVRRCIAAVCGRWR